MTSSRTAEFVRRLAEPDPGVLAQVENPDEITTRILAAALEQAELVGMLVGSALQASSPSRAV